MGCSIVTAVGFILSFHGANGDAEPTRHAVTVMGSTHFSIKEVDDQTAIVRVNDVYYTVTTDDFEGQSNPYWKLKAEVEDCM